LGLKLGFGCRGSGRGDIGASLHISIALRRDVGLGWDLWSRALAHVRAIGSDVP
jgi:hypothetical protein